MIFPISDLWLGGMILMRISGFFLLIPFLANQTIPKRVRGALAIGFTILLIPLVEPSVAVPEMGLEWFLIAMQEILIGSLMGFGVRLIFFAVEFASQIIAMEASLAMTTALNPLTSSPATAIAPLLFYLTILFIFILGIDYQIYQSLYRSFEIKPIGDSVLDHLDIKQLVIDCSGIFQLGLKMAAPVVAIAFVINVVFAILGKTAPKVNVLMISFPIRISAGLILLTLTFDLIVQYLIVGTQDMGNRILEFLVQ